MLMTDFQQVYQLLFDHYGPQHWWPADTPFEVLVGAVLTQNTSWGNVGKALVCLRERGLLEYETFSQLAPEEIAPLIRSSGYYNLKAQRLRNLINLVEEEYGGNFALFRKGELHPLREQLLTVRGIGPETADAILLYVCKKLSFVVDTYTHRVFSRHGMVDEESDYHSIQEQFVNNLPEDTELYGEYHALVVRVAKDFCKKKAPRCEGCPLDGLHRRW